MAGAGSISARQITAAAKSSAEKVLEQQKLAKPPKYEIGFCPPPWWWVGIVLDPEPDPWRLADAAKMAAALHSNIAAAVPSVKGGKSGAVLLDGKLTIGFVPPKEINILHE